MRIKEDTVEGSAYIDAIREEALETLGYFLKPSELFSEIAKRGNSDTNTFILLRIGCKTTQKPARLIMQSISG